MDMTTETSALHIEKLIHLNKLSPSKRNVRKNGSTPVKQLAASIKRVGLLQNLIVTASSEGEGLFEVEGGKRRLIALNLLAKRKQIAPDYDVRCLVVPDAAAVTVSLTENMLREAMHPADEFAAFQVLIDEGKSVEDIAADFGVTPLVVSRRLRLANVSARLMKDYRGDKVTLEQLMALAITDDHAAQDTAFYSAPAWQQGARELRARLTEQEIEADRDGVARFVGLDAYSAAGGAVRRDLFADDGKGIYLSDRELLDKLAIEKLAATAESVKAEGWSWSDVAPRTTSSDFYAFQRVRASRRKPTAQEAKKVVKLQKRSEEIETVLNGSDDLDDATRETLSEENDGIDAEQAELQNGLQVYAKKAIAVAGAVVTIDGQGKVVVYRGLVRDEDSKRAKALERGQGDGTDAGSDDKPKVKASVSEVLARRLSAHRTVALQAELAVNPSVALVAVVHRLVLRTLCDGRCGTSALRIDGTPQVSLERFAPEVPTSAAAVALAEARDAWKARLPRGDNSETDTGTLFAALLALTQEELLSLLAVCAACCIDVVTPSESDCTSAELAVALDLDMTKWWRATADSYFAHVSKARINEALTSFAPEYVKQLDGFKKAELATKAGELAVGTRWLPAMLRRPE